MFDGRDGDEWMNQIRAASSDAKIYPKAVAGLGLGSTLHSATSTPLLPSPTLSAGECKVSRGEQKKISQHIGLARNLRAPRSKLRSSPMTVLRLLLCSHSASHQFLT